MCKSDHADFVRYKIDLHTQHKMHEKQKESTQRYYVVHTIRMIVLLHGGKRERYFINPLLSRVYKEREKVFIQVH